MKGEGAFDCNDMKSTGIYYCYNATTNLPSGATGGMLIVCANSSGSNVVQLYTAITRTVSTIYKRALLSGSWGDWMTV